MNERITLISGLPASGKSSLAKSLGGKVLEFDSIVKKFGSYEEMNEEWETALKHFQLMVQFGGFDIVVDNFNTKKSRQNITSVLSFKPDIILVRCPVEECIRRNNLRLKTMVSNEKILKMYWLFEPICKNEGFNSILIYDSLTNALKGGIV